jgi:hypothetical protein
MAAEDGFVLPKAVKNHTIVFNDIAKKLLPVLTRQV